MKIIKKILSEGCFDLQFRRDVKYKRLNKPVYYGWKSQFVIVLGYENEELLRGIQNSLNCGRLHFVNGNKIRYSVQDVDNLYNKVIPFFKKYQLSSKKKQDFELWAQAIEILYQNKRKPIASWNKEDFQRLIDIQKAMQKYKVKIPSSFKWLSIAESIAKTI